MIWPEHKFMVNYEKLSEAALDQYLALSYLPLRKEKVNLSDKDNFLSMIIPKLKHFDLLDEFGGNVIHFISEDKFSMNKKSNEALAVKVFCMDMRQIKMAALKTYHDNSDIIEEKLKKIKSKSPYAKKESEE
jgi:hypothetical protein